MHILVTGANGFVGKALCKCLVQQGVSVTAVVRNAGAEIPNVKLVVKNISSKTDWQNTLNNIDVIIHLAGRAHVMKELAEDPYKTYAEVNIEATRHLADQAIMHGVKRFVFLSSIGVNDNFSKKPFNEHDQPNPQELYAISKKNAEDALRKVASTSNLEVVIIRPPLVYGRGAKGNFEKLAKLCNRRLPLPLGAISNKRSLIYIENLTDFLRLCTTHSKAANETFLISDDDDVSTSQLIKTIIFESGKKAILIPIPQFLIRCLFKLIGKKNVYTKICGNLQVDISKAKSLLDWVPPFSFRDGIKKTLQK